MCCAWKPIPDPATSSRSAKCRSRWVPSRHGRRRTEEDAAQDNVSGTRKRSGLMADPQLGSDVPIREFLNGLASADSPHGAVSGAAGGGAVGTSLLLMVAALPTTRSDSIDERTALMRAGAALGELQEQLIETIETETAVKLFAARSLPQASDTQRSKREAAIQFALRAAADVPLEVIRLCALGLTHAQTVAASSCRA